ncbi:FecR family protein [Odoribacter splanchnicus]|uniref:FecR family protein n=1 Tax=Odoribacter splanchnicus TaxID=28118 RepID=UPI0034A462E0
MLEYDNNYIRRLIQLDLVGGLSPEEKGKLEDWINESEEHRLLFCKIKKQLSINEIRNYLQTDVEDAWKKVREKTFGAPPVRPRIRPKWLKYAAVVLPVLLSITLWYTWKEEMKNKQATVARLSPVLTLDNGEKYQLDPEEQTEIYVNEEVKAYQAGGGLIYDTTARQEENKYNRIEVPRGSEYWIVLPDGTRVWLNAATELKYPVAFHAKERRVYLKGEAYFEVAPDKNRPFYVETEEVKIRVLGTVFDVNTHYTRGVRTVLVEGAVALEWGDQKEIRMKPGELADFDRTTTEVTLKEVDVTSYISWKEGYFVFEDEPLEEIMHTLSLWYDKEFLFVGKRSRALHFSGHIKRYERIETILSAITDVTGVEFRMNGQIILIH